METNSRDERQMLNNIGRIATALERIATVMEAEAQPITAQQLIDVLMREEAVASTRMSREEQHGE
jgi:hypothetical protein